MRCTLVQHASHCRPAGNSPDFPTKASLITSTGLLWTMTSLLPWSSKVLAACLALPSVCRCHVCVCLWLTSALHWVSLGCRCILTVFLLVALHAAKVQEAANKRASSSSSPSSTKPTPPVEFDPTDEADTNYAVLMCLMGAVGVRVGEPKSTSSPHFNKEVKDAHTRQVYCSIVGVSVRAACFP